MPMATVLVLMLLVLATNQVGDAVLQVLEELPEKVRMKIPVDLDPAHRPVLEAVRQEMAALEASGCRAPGGVLGVWGSMCLGRV